MQFKSGVFSCLFLLLIFSNCSEPTLLGEEIIQQTIGNQPIFTDTLTLNVSTEHEERIRTDNFNFYLLGGIEDPIFGKSNASFSSQFRMASNDLSISQTDIFDSLVLNLHQELHYGNDSSSFTIEVYELTEDLVIDQEYYSDETPIFDSEVIGKLSNYVHNFEDSIISIPLNSDWAEAFFQIAKDETSSIFDNNDNFLEFFKGLHVRYIPEESDNQLIATLNLVESKMTLHYHNDTDSTDLSSFDFIINDNAQSVNYYSQDYTGSEVESILNQENQGVAFLQGMAGLNTKIEIPYLENLGNVIVNQANLQIFEVNDENNDTLFYQPSSVIATWIPEEQTNFQSIADVLEENPAIYDFDGNYSFEIDTTGNDVNVINQHYDLNIAIHLNEMLNGTLNPKDPIYILPAARANSPTRNKIGDGKNNAYQMKLNLTYTSIE